MVRDEIRDLVTTYCLKRCYHFYEQDYTAVLGHVIGGQCIPMSRELYAAQVK